MDYKEHIESIRQLIGNSVGGYRDDEALRQIAESLSIFQMVRHSSYTYEKIGEVRRCSDIYFSPRKHLRQPGGLPQVRLWIYQALDSLQSSLSMEDSSKT